MRLSWHNRIARPKRERKREREAGELASVAINLSQLRTAVYACEREAAVRPADGTSVNDQHKKFSVSQTETAKEYETKRERERDTVQRESLNMQIIINLRVTQRTCKCRCER